MLKGISIKKLDNSDNNASTNNANNNANTNSVVKNTSSSINNSNQLSEKFMYNFLGKKVPSPQVIENDNVNNNTKIRTSKNVNNGIIGKKNNTSIEYLRTMDKENNSKVIHSDIDFSFNYNSQINKCAAFLLNNEINEFRNSFNLLEKHYNNSVVNNIHYKKILAKEINHTVIENPEEIDFSDVESCTNTNINISTNNEKANQLKPIFINTANKILLLKNCNFCISNTELHKTIISSSENIYLLYPYSFGSITKYHFVISSHEHFNSAAALEDDVYTELRNYMKSITAFNAEKDHSTVFLEYSKSISQSNHFIIEAIPFKHSLIDEVKMFYKKALSEQDSYWSDNKQLVETFSHRGNIKKMINANFSYLHVDFNCNGGYLHIVSDQSKFDKLFLKEILSVALEKTPFEIKYPSKLSPNNLEKVVNQYREDFKKFDWVEYS